MLLITFIENTIKYNPAANETLEIQLLVTKELSDNNLYLKIDIIDSGQGFPQDVLDNLLVKKSVSPDKRTHVGIPNSIQRLTLLYGDSHEIHFFNEKQGGAHIQLTIPYQIQEDSK